MPTFIVTDANKGVALKILPGFKLNWVIDFKLANRYTSKYAAKRHLKELDNLPEGVKIIELLTTKENVNG